MKNEQATIKTKNPIFTVHAEICTECAFIQRYPIRLTLALFIVPKVLAQY